MGDKTTTKAAPAAKDTKAAPAAKTGRTLKDIALDQKIALGVDSESKPYGAKNNPKREGTKAAERFESYKNGMTVAKAIEAGMKPRHIRRDAEHGYITLSGGTPAATGSTEKAAA